MQVLDEESASRMLLDAEDSFPGCEPNSQEFRTKAAVRKLVRIVRDLEAALNVERMACALRAEHAVIVGFQSRFPFLVRDSVGRAVRMEAEPTYLDSREIQPCRR